MFNPNNNQNSGDKSSNFPAWISFILVGFLAAFMFGFIGFASPESLPFFGSIFGPFFLLAAIMIFVVLKKAPNITRINPMFRMFQNQNNHSQNQNFNHISNQNQDMNEDMDSQFKLKICPYCGTELKNMQKKCPNCGSPLEY